jgi:protein gp37
MAKRLKAMGQKRYRNGFDVTLQPDIVRLPLRWREPRLIFVNSMSDLFHEDVPEEFIQRVFDTMKRADQHIFQILTKRSQRLVELAPGLSWPSNVWQGVSVEDSDHLWRIAHLQEVPSAIRFISVEPLLGPIPRLPLEGIHWVIVGGESGPKHRPTDASWVKKIRDQCIDADVPFFFKQWGGRTPKSGGRLLEGEFWDEMPATNHSAARLF